MSFVFRCNGNITKKGSRDGLPLLYLEGVKENKGGGRSPHLT